MQKFDITAPQIDQVVMTFYARIRRDEVLGPVFIEAIGTGAEEWRIHEAKITDFWCSAIGLGRGFSGNPMRTHLANPDIRPEDFARWLKLFRTTCDDVLPPDSARNLAALADRIGSSLSMGLRQMRAKRGAVPTLN